MMTLLTKMTPLAANMENLIPLPTPPSTIFRPFGDEDAAAADEEVGKVTGTLRKSTEYSSDFTIPVLAAKKRTAKGNH